MRRLIAAIVLCAALCSRRAGAEPLRILVAASHSRGSEGEQELRHAREDADQVHQVLTALGGFAPDATFRLFDPTAAALRATIDRVRALAARHRPEEVTFLLYFSGHGDRDHLRLGDESLATSELAERVATVPAAMRVLVTDACRTDPTRAKGITTEPGFAVALPGPATTGVVWLYASDTGEPAQESDELRGALFTHYWVSGLRGAADVNGDGRVTLTESYEFAYSQTLFRSGRGSGVLQHPTASLAINQAAPIVLTETFGRATRIELPQRADTRYLVYALGSRSVTAELWSDPQRRVVLAVAPGRYIVHQHTRPAGWAAAEVELAPGQHRLVAATEFRPLPEERVVGKGGQLVLRRDEVDLALGAGPSRIADGQMVATVRYLRVDGPWALGLGLRGGLGRQHTPVNSVRLATLGLQATAEHRWQLGSTMATLDAGAAIDAIDQHVERVDSVRLAAAGYSTGSTSLALAAGPMAAAAWRLPLSRAAWLQVVARAEVLFARFEGGPRPLWSTLVGLGGGLAF
jgi:hypothetical protein